MKVGAIEMQVAAVESNRGWQYLHETGGHRGIHHNASIEKGPVERAFRGEFD